MGNLLLYNNGYEISVTGRNNLLFIQGNCIYRRLQLVVLESCGDEMMMMRFSLNLLLVLFWAIHYSHPNKHKISLSESILFSLCSKRAEKK